MKKIFLFFALLGLIVSACEVTVDEKLELTSEDISIYVEETSQISATAATNISYESADAYYAKVSSNGLVTGLRVGNTEVSVSTVDEQKKLLVEVLPNFNTYTTPILDWKKSKSSIITELGEPDEILDESIVYYNTDDKVDFVMYTFNSNNILELSSVVLKNMYEDELGSYLAERYKYWADQNGISVYINALDPTSATLAIGATTLLDTHIIVLYQEYSNKKAATINSSERIKSSLIKLLK